MNRVLFSAALAVFFIANVTLAKDKNDQAKRVSLTVYQFTEADFKQLDRVHVTAGTTVAKSDQGNHDRSQANSFEDIGSTITTQHVVDWMDQNGNVWSVSVDNLLQPGNLRITAPIIQSGPFAEDTPQRLDESLAINVTAIPEPASVSLLAIGAALICPRRSNRNKGNS